MRRWELADGGEDSPIMFVGDWVGQRGWVNARHGAAGAPGLAGRGLRLGDGSESVRGRGRAGEGTRGGSRPWAPAPLPGGRCRRRAAAAPGELLHVPEAWRVSRRPASGAASPVLVRPRRQALDLLGQAARGGEGGGGNDRERPSPGPSGARPRSSRRRARTWRAADPVGAAVVAVVTDRPDCCTEMLVATAWTLAATASAFASPWPPWSCSRGSTARPRPGRDRRSWPSCPKASSGCGWPGAARLPGAERYCTWPTRATGAETRGQEGG